MRMLVLLLAALGTLVEAVAFGGLFYVLGAVIGAYSMSMGGIPAERGRVAMWVLGAVLAAGLAVLAVLLVVAAVRRRPLGRPSRVLIVCALVLQGILGLVVVLAAPGVALIGVLFVFACLLLGLVTEPPPRPMRARHSAPG
jgi:hypothetical protein